MFEHSLIDLDEKKQPRRWASLPVAIGLHLVVVATVTVAQAWHVAEVPEPAANIVFFDLKPQPLPPAAAPPQGSQTAQQPARPVKPPQGPAQPVQPETVPDQEPQPVTGPIVADFVPIGPDTGTGSPDGVVGSFGDGEDTDLIGGPGGADHSIGEPEAPEPPSRAVRVGGAVKRPDFLSGPQPRYTEMARKAGLQGVVILEATIDEQGRVTDLRILKGLPLGLDQSAVDAVSQWRYRPATLHGKPVKVLFTLTVDFRLQR